jgi:hypothetical protein
MQNVPPLTASLTTFEGDDLLLLCSLEELVFALFEYESASRMGPRIAETTAGIAHDACMRGARVSQIKSLQTAFHSTLTLFV